MKYYPDQFGSVTKEFLLRTLKRGSTIDTIKTHDYPDWLSSDLSMKKTSVDKRNSIKDVFELEKYQFSLISESCDFYAIYYAQWKNGRTWGVYFIARSCIEEIKNISEAGRIQFLECILAHEIGHSFIETELGAVVGKEHSESHKGYCHFEEALCNLLAIIACEKVLKIKIDKEVRDILLRLHVDGGLAGYGEYDKLTNVMIYDWREIIAGSKCQSILSSSKKSNEDFGENIVMNRWLRYYEETQATIPIYIDTCN